MANNRFLLDTQVLIWFFSNTLSSEISDLLKNPDNTICTSVVSAWEIIIKKKTGKLKSPPNIKKAVEKGGFNILPINFEHVLGLKKLPNIHKDPFDRILISQAKAEKLILITSDKKIEKYDVRLLKASL